jgi:predicted O-methyltransferase YrrM
VTDRLPPAPPRILSAALAAIAMLREPKPTRLPDGRGQLAPAPSVEYVAETPLAPSVRFPPRTEGDVNMSDRQLAFIEKCAREAPVKRFLEIGAYFGTSTSIIAQVGPVTVVDWMRGNAEAGLWMPLERDHQRRAEGLLRTLYRADVRDRVTILEGMSGEVVPHLRHERYGLALIDGDHSFSGCLTDLRNAWDLVVPGGFVLLDDYAAAPVNGEAVDDVRRAWRAFAFERSLNGGLRFTTPDSEGPKLVAVRKPE